jgi:micrococcal nuclease
MTMRALLLAALVSLLAAAAPAESGPSQREPARVARVIDGDTIALADGRHVRLLQIDTPEPRDGECFSRAAGRALGRLVRPGSRVELERDPRLDAVDGYGRLLRYVWADGRNANLELVRQGAATVWLYRGERGRYAARLLAAGRAAREARRGLWGACPAARWNPYAPAST